MTRARFAAFAVLFTAGAQHYARADTAVPDVVRAPSNEQLGKWKKFEGSLLEAATYIGSGSFYVSGYRNPYVSLALYAKPTYDLGTRYKLALRARLYIEEELTQPDNPVGRRFYPYDPWVWLAADNLHTFERSKIQIGGIVRTVLPLSYESRYEHLLFAIGGGPNVGREFTFGQVNDEARKWTLRLSYAFVVMKYVQTSEFRGDGPGDTSGCLAPPSAGPGGIGAAGGPTPSTADRCGGPVNNNFLIGNTFVTSLAHGKWTAAVSLYVSNAFKYSFPDDALTAANATATGRVDQTWGIASLSREIRPHIALNLGVASLQPALDSRYRYPRFPFWDLSGASYNNYSQVFFSVSGTL